ncbi:hypothetical protein FDENT_5682 [Fusarium denticulatum]|uniref:Zn(2)-C6 fungal-type domain-containing protein n=1 Tax=Fusarium denticulatum TaxID=48507 RepID=A0A8H5UA00_9HYPO|nr:hypothetical protein FDENT_5682 [Fusarium denticulatum]
MSEEHPVLKPKKRNSADAESVGDTPAPRSKRGKYTSVACDDCKKKKLKCIPSEDNACERCIAGGLTCTFATSTQATKEKPDDSQNIQALNHQLSELRQQMSDLVGVVRELKDQNQNHHQTLPHDASTVSSHNIVTHSPASTHRGEMPKQPQFVGPTRSAFGILVSERSLNRMGVPKFDSMPPSGAQSPIEPALDSINDLSFWHCCTASDITKYLVNFQEEVESVYPFIDIAEYIAQSKEILQAIRGGGGFEDEGRVSGKDIDIAKVAIATGILLEEPSEELLAWRSIGIAARQALEMGLHRKRSLLDNFKDTDSRRLATRVFWCVYVLDRRWSFGTSLSFALVDKDVDPELPKPDEEYLYLQCMVGYGQLCSKIWEAIPPFGSASQTIPDDTAAILDLKTQDWLDSIPPHLRLRHPRLGLAPRAQPRLPHRLRALLYLRGNYARILIYRHHLMSTASIAANPQNAWLVVDIAQDTIQVLVHLHATTDIYKRQQNVFNYFLLSALAVIFLAVCHAPEIFSVPCKRTFSDGVELVRGLSRHNIVSKRLWKSIRGMIPRMNTFGFPQNGEDGEPRKDDENGATSEQTVPQVDVNAEEHVPMAMPVNEAFSFGDMMFGDTDVANSVPDMFQMSESLLNLFNAFGEGQQFLHPVPSTFSEEGEYAIAAEQGKDISMRFQGLI